MPGTPASRPTHARSTGDEPLHELVDRVLDALLAVTGAPHAELSVDGPHAWRRARGTAGPDGPDDPDDPDDEDDEDGAGGIELTGGPDGTVHLRVAAGEPARATAERFLPPLVAVVGLRTRLKNRLAEADAAVESVEGTAMLDLATGIVMARTGRDATAARDALVAWADRTGTELGELSADAVLELLTAGDLQEVSGGQDGVDQRR